MKPIYLQRAALDCALASDLQGAAAALRQGLPSAERFELHELQESRGYLPAQGSAASLDQCLDRTIGTALGDGPRRLDDCLLIVASTTLDITELEALARQRQGFATQDSTRLDRLAAELQQRWGFAAAFTLNTACTSAANALLYGARLIDAGVYPRVLVLAFETPSQVAMQGFGALGLSSPSGQYRPFHPERDGLILGEAYCAALLAATPGEQPLARLLGGFSACDTSSLTTTLEDGSHIHWVMQRALASAGCAAERIDLVKLHGTATGANDQAEHNGMRLLFGAQMPALNVLKPWLGHTLGACGLSESLLLLESLRADFLPSLAYADQALLPLAPPTRPLAEDCRLLANFFGFGGNNASLVWQACPAGAASCR